MAIVGIMALPALAVTQAHEAPKAAAAVPGNTGSSQSLGFALAFALGGAALGGAFGQSNAIAKAVDAVARQPEAGARIQGMMIIGLALIETLVIYVLLICFVWGGKIV
ncbi:MAG TPA: ATP synthase F0 subunit C [Planctomycetota bacterium]